MGDKTQAIHQAFSSITGCIWSFDHQSLAPDDDDDDEEEEEEEEEKARGGEGGGGGGMFSWQPTVLDW